MQFARQPACRFISLFNYIPLAERGQIAGRLTVSVNTIFGSRRLSSRPPRFSSGVSTRDLGNHLNQTAQTGHSERSGAVFSSSFASANEPRHAVEESLFDLIAQATSVRRWLLAITRTVHSVRRPSTRSSRSCF